MHTFKSTLVTIMMMVIVTVTLTSCGGGTPKGSDSDVKETVRQIYKDQIEVIAYNKAFGEVAKDLQDYPGKLHFKILLKNCGCTEGMNSQPGEHIEDYEEQYKKSLEETKKKDPKFAPELEEYKKKYWSKLEQLVKKYKENLKSPDAFRIENIRTVEIDDEVGKSTSDATVKIFADEKQIRYTAQYNEDGNIYVEVFDL